MKKKITRFMVCVLSLVFAWGVGGTCFADNAAEVVIQVSYPGGDDYVAFYNGVVGDIDTSKKDYYVNVHITLLDASGEPATAGPTGDALGAVSATLETDMGVTSSIQENIFLTDSAVLSFDVIDVGPAARAHVRYACNVAGSCDPGTDTLTATVTGLDPASAEVEVRAPEAATLMLRTLRVAGVRPADLFEDLSVSIYDQSNNAGISALAGDDIYFEVWAVEENDDFTTAPELDGQTVTVTAYADYNANDDVGDPPYETIPAATVTAEFSDGIATGTVTIEKAGTNEFGGAVDQMRVGLTATTGSGSSAVSTVGTDITHRSVDWVGMKPRIKNQLIIGEDPGATGNLIVEKETWYVLDDNNTVYGPTSSVMAVFVADEYGNPLIDTVNVSSAVTGPLVDATKTLMDANGGNGGSGDAWDITTAVKSDNWKDGVWTTVSAVGQSNEQEATGGGTGDRGKPLEAILTLSDEGLVLASDTATVYLVRWDNDAPLSLDLHLDNDFATTTGGIVAGDTVTLYITSASGSEGNPTTSEIVEYNDDLTIEAYECDGSKALLISKSTSDFDQATSEGLELKSPLPNGTTRHIEIPIKVYGEVTKGQERSVCFKISDSTKGLKDITLYQASRDIDNLYAAPEDDVKISSLPVANEGLDADPIVITGEMLVGENTLLTPASVDTADEYGNVVEDTPSYGITSDVGVAVVDATRGASITFVNDDVGETATVTVTVPGVGSRDLQITNIAATAASAGLMVCEVEGPVPATPGGEAIVQVKASSTTAVAKPIIVVVDEDNSVTDSELRDFSGVSQGTDYTDTLPAGSPTTVMVRVVVSAPEAGTVTLEVGDTSGGASALDTGACTVLFAVDDTIPTASIAVNNATDPGTAEVEITVEDDYAVDLGNSAYTIEQDGSDVTGTLACTNAGDGTTEGTITCANSGGGLDDGSSYDVEVTPQDMAGNVGTTVSGTFMVSTCEPVVTIDPSSASVKAAETVDFSATTDCNGDVTASAIYTWAISSGGGTAGTGSGCTGSSIDADGLYTAGTPASGTSCVDTVVVTDTAHGSATDSADVTVSTCTDTVTVSPSSQTIEFGQTQQFTASTDCGGTSVSETYTWSVSGTCSGSNIDSSSGLYTAPSSGTSDCSDTVTATGATSGEQDTATVTVETGVSMEVTPATLLRSRWIPLPVMMVITGDGTSFEAFVSTVTWSPVASVIALPPLIWGAESIWQTIFVSPSWLAGAEAETLTVTVTTGSEMVTDTVAIDMLPFILDEQ